jgi:hypothetical protein
MLYILIPYAVYENVWREKIVRQEEYCSHLL